MYQEKLEEDLKKIFKTKAVRFCRAEGLLEQDVLCVDITAQRLGAQEGKAWARVSGTVAVRGASKKNPAGFLTKKVAEAAPQLLSRFWFGASESPVLLPIEWEIKAYKLDFTYFYQEEYAPVKGIIEYAKLFWQYIIGA